MAPRGVRDEGGGKAEGGKAEGPLLAKELLGVAPRERGGDAVGARVGARGGELLARLGGLLPAAARGGVAAL